VHSVDKGQKDIVVTLHKSLKHLYIKPYVSRSRYTLCMDLYKSSRKEIGAYGESAAVKYLQQHDFQVLDRNVTYKIGELDIVAQKDDILHIVEVKSIACNEFPGMQDNGVNVFNPVENLHTLKIRQVVRTGKWHVAACAWVGEWQVDGITVLIRRSDGVARVRYFPHIV